MAELNCTLLFLVSLTLTAKGGNDAPKVNQMRLERVSLCFVVRIESSQQCTRCRISPFPNKRILGSELTAWLVVKWCQAWPPFLGSQI